MNVSRLRVSLLCRSAPETVAGRAKNLMKTKNPLSALSPMEKEVIRLHTNGKAPDIIAIRLGVKLSRVLSMLPKP